MQSHLAVHNSVPCQGIGSTPGQVCRTRQCPDLTSYCGLKGAACQMMVPCCMASVTSDTSVSLGQVQPMLGGQSRNSDSSHEWLRYLGPRG